MNVAYLMQQYFMLRHDNALVAAQLVSPQQLQLNREPREACFLIYTTPHPCEDVF